MNLSFSICLPSFNGSAVIADTIKSILNQTYVDFELIIVDDNSKDDTEKIVRLFKDNRIKFYKNGRNLGYPENLEECRKKAQGDIIYLMGQDDILAKNALLHTYKAFNSSDLIGAVTRTYYWFDNSIKVPVRSKAQLNPDKDEIVKITDDFSRLKLVFSTLDQLSGLAFRRKYMDTAFHPDIFPCHVYPFASILKKYPIIFLKDYEVAVRIQSSQCRYISSIYDKSPIQSWVDMFSTVFYEKEFQHLKKYFIRDFVATNYVGLVQIKNYAKLKYFFREIGLLLKYRWQNFFNPFFWFFSLGCLILPASFLIPLVDWYKNRVNSLRFRNIQFQYDLSDSNYGFK